MRRPQRPGAACRQARRLRREPGAGLSAARQASTRSAPRRAAPRWRWCPRPPGSCAAGAVRPSPAERGVDAKPRYLDATAPRPAQSVRCEPQVCLAEGMRAGERPRRVGYQEHARPGRAGLGEQFVPASAAHHSSTMYAWPPPSSTSKTCAIRGVGEPARRPGGGHPPGDARENSGANVSTETGRASVSSMASTWSRPFPVVTWSTSR